MPDPSVPTAGLLGSQMGYPYHPAPPMPPVALPMANPGWEKIGEAAQAGLRGLENLLPYENPEAIAQRKLGVASAQRGIDQINWAKSKGDMGYWLGEVVGDQYRQVGPTAAGVRMPMGPPQPTVTGTGQATPDEIINALLGGDEEQQKKQQPPTQQPAVQTNQPENMLLLKNQPQQPAPPESKPLIAPPPGSVPGNPYYPLPGSVPPPRQTGPSTQATTPSPSMFAGRSAQAPGPDAFQGPTQAQTNLAVQQGLQRNQFAGSGQGVPAGYNPSQTATPPNQGPELVGGGEPADQGSAISQVTQQPGVALANWQAQNIHPVASPGAVKQALADNVGTIYNKAEVIYQPSGGINGEPSFGIKLPDGGQSTLSLSQLTSTPWGRKLVAGQNASHAVQAQIAQPPQTNQPGNMLLQQQPGQQPGQPSMPMPPQGPPGAQPATDQQSALAAARAPIPNLGAYTNVPSQGGAALQDLTAQVAPTVVDHYGNPGINQESQRGARNPETDAAFQARLGVSRDEVAAGAAQVTPEQEAANPVNQTGDHIVYTDQGGHEWRRDHTNNQLYTTRPGAQSTWDQQRFYWDGTDWTEYKLPENALNENMQKEFPYLSPDVIEKMPRGDKEGDLMAAWYRRNGKDPDPNTLLRLDALREQHVRGTRLLDTTTALDPTGQNPALYGDRMMDIQKQAQLARSFEAPLANPPPSPLAQLLTGNRDWRSSPGFSGAIKNFQQTWFSLQSGYQQPNAIRQYLADQVNGLTDALNAAPGMTAGGTATTPGQPGMNLWTPYGGLSTTALSPAERKDNLDAIHGIYQNDPHWPDSMRRFIYGRDREYHRTLSSALLNGERVPPEYVDDDRQILSGKPVYDAEEMPAVRPGNFPKSHGQLSDEARGTASASPTPSPKPTPSPTPTTPTATPQPPATPRQPTYQEAQSAPLIKSLEDAKKYKSGTLIRDAGDGLLKYLP